MHNSNEDKRSQLTQAKIRQAELGEIKSRQAKLSHAHTRAKSSAFSIVTCFVFCPKSDVPKNDEMACLLCTHDTSKSTAFSSVTCFVFLVRKAMFRKMTKWHVCYAHTIHQTNEKQTSRKQTIKMPKCLVCNGNTSNLYKKLHVTCFVF